MLDPVAEPPHRQMRVFGKPMRGVAVLPAAAIFERLRQIPMVEADPGLDPGFHDAVDEFVVKFEPLEIGRTAPLGQDARPGGRQPVGAEAEFAHQRHILRPAMIVIAGNIAGIAAHDPAR